MRRLWVIPAIALVVLSGLACGGKKPPVPAEKKAESVAAAGVPAPGVMVAQSPEPMELESSWVWKDMWSSVRDAGHCSFQAIGLDTAGKAPGEVMVKELDPHIVLLFANTALDAAECRKIRVHVANAEQLAVWWAGEAEAAAEAYPFAAARFAPMHKIEEGVFEVDFDASAKERAASGAHPVPGWTGAIRLLRFDPGVTGSKILSFQRVEGEFARKWTWPESPPVKANVVRNPAAMLMALTHRATVTHAGGDIVALADYYSLNPESATQESRKEAVELARGAGVELLEKGDTKNALRLFSAAGKASGSIADFLYLLRDTLTPEQRSKLWPEEPYLIVQDFSGAGAPVLRKFQDGQPRELVAAATDDKVALRGEHSARIEVSDSKQDGESTFGFNTRIALSDKPFHLRTHVRTESQIALRIALNFAFPSAKQSATSADPATRTLDDGWTLFDLKHEFYKERLAYAQTKGYDVADGEINAIMLLVPTGAANKCWLDRIELYIPQETPAK